MRAYLLNLARTLLVTLWAGSLWTVGYLAAPLFFITLQDRMLAGTIAGTLFRAEAWLSLACGLLLLVIFRADPYLPSRKSCTRLVIGMLLCVLVGYFGLQPFMAEIRASAALTGGVMDEVMRARFGLLHGVASGIYLIHSLLAVALVWRSRAA
ncbi:MAG: DUF4149 domain-containing protein [Oxalobacteraceae bacterium]|jgi:hypothetical protein